VLAAGSRRGDLGLARFTTFNQPQENGARELGASQSSPPSLARDRDRGQCGPRGAAALSPVRAFRILVTAVWRPLRPHKKGAGYTDWASCTSAHLAHIPIDKLYIVKLQVAQPQFLSHE
jgi:hypothetical protein